MSFVNVCRLCLSKNSLVSVFDKRLDSENNMKDVIFITTGVEICENDVISQMICEKCRHVSIRMLQFRKSSQKHDKYLKKRYRKMLKTSTVEYDNPRTGVRIETEKKEKPNMETKEVNRPNQKFHQTIRDLLKIYPLLKLPSICLQSNINPCIIIETDMVENVSNKKTNSEQKCVRSSKPENRNTKNITSAESTATDSSHISVSIVMVADKNSKIDYCTKEIIQKQYMLSVSKNVEENLNDARLAIKPKKRRLTDSDVFSDDNTKNFSSSEPLPEKKPCQSVEQLYQEESVPLILCSICNSVHNNVRELKRHQFMHLRCQFCKSKFKTIGSKKAHIQDFCEIKKMMNRVPSVKLEKIELDLKMRTKYPEAFIGYPLISGLQLNYSSTGVTSADKTPGDDKSEDQTPGGKLSGNKTSEKDDKIIGWNGGCNDNDVDIMKVLSDDDISLTSRIERCNNSPISKKEIVPVSKITQRILNSKISATNSIIEGEVPSINVRSQSFTNNPVITITQTAESKLSGNKTSEKDEKIIGWNGGCNDNDVDIEVLSDDDISLTSRIERCNNTPISKKEIVPVSKITQRILNSKISATNSIIEGEVPSINVRSPSFTNNPVITTTQTPESKLSGNKTSEKDEKIIGWNGGCNDNDVDIEVLSDDDISLTSRIERYNSTPISKKEIVPVSKITQMILDSEISATNSIIEGEVPSINVRSLSFTNNPVISTTPSNISSAPPVIYTSLRDISITPRVISTTPPVISTTPPVISTPTVMFTTPVISTTSPVISTTAPFIYTAPAVISTTPPVISTTLAAVHTTPVISTTTSVISTTLPVISTTLVISTTPPVIFTNSPVIYTTPTVMFTTPVISINPSLISTTPPVSSTTSSVISTTPTVVFTTPVISTTTSVISTTPPVISTTPIVISTTSPVISTTPTVISTTPPVISTTPPVISTTPPIISATLPVISTTPTVMLTTPIISTTTSVISTATSVISATCPVISTTCSVISKAPEDSLDSVALVPKIKIGNSTALDKIDLKLTDIQLFAHLLTSKTSFKIKEDGCSQTEMPCNKSISVDEYGQPKAFKQLRNLLFSYKIPILSHKGDFQTRYIYKTGYTKQKRVNKKKLFLWNDLTPVDVKVSNKSGKIQRASSRSRIPVLIAPKVRTPNITTPDLIRNCSTTTINAFNSSLSEVPIQPNNKNNTFSSTVESLNGPSNVHVHTRVAPSNVRIVNASNLQMYSQRVNMTSSVLSNFGVTNNVSVTNNAVATDPTYGLLGANITGLQTTPISYINDLRSPPNVNPFGIPNMAVTQTTPVVIQNSMNISPNISNSQSMIYSLQNSLVVQNKVTNPLPNTLPMTPASSFNEACPVFGSIRVKNVWELT